MALTTVTDYLELTAAKFPAKVAFADATREMTFSELRTEARRVASVLLGLGLHHQPVAVFLDKSAVCIAAFLGALYSGNFIPLWTRRCRNPVFKRFSQPSSLPSS